MFFRSYSRLVSAPSRLMKPGKVLFKSDSPKASVKRSPLLLVTSLLKKLSSVERAQVTKEVRKLNCEKKVLEAHPLSVKPPIQPAVSFLKKKKGVFPSLSRVGIPAPAGKHANFSRKLMMVTKGSKKSTSSIPHSFSKPMRKTIDHTSEAKKNQVVVLQATPSRGIGSDGHLSKNTPSSFRSKPKASSIRLTKAMSAHRTPALKKIKNATTLKGKNKAHFVTSHSHLPSSSMHFKPRNFVFSPSTTKKSSTSPSYLPLRVTKSKNVLSAVQKVRGIASAPSIKNAHLNPTTKHSSIPTSMVSKHVSLPISQKSAKSSVLPSKKVLFKPFSARKNVFSPAILKKTKLSSHSVSKKLMK